MSLPATTLKKLLLGASVVAEEEFPRLEAESKRTGVPIERLLIAQGRLIPSYLSELVSKFLDIPVVDFHATTIDPEAVMLIPETVARQRQIVIFAKDEKEKQYSVAMADPTDVDAMNYLREYLKGEILPHIATDDSLKLGYQVYKKRASADFEKIIDARVNELVMALRDKKDANLLESVPLAQLFDNLIDYAATLNASDVYVQPEEEFVNIRFRVDGMLHDIVSIDSRLNEGLVARAKILSALRIDEHKKPQDGRFKFRSANFEIDIRTAIMPTFFGEKITLRLLTGAQQFISFEELGIGEDTGKKLRQEIAKPFGMILSTGPTGSGKTTTIYAILNILNRPEVHITTIEDPVEYLIPRVSQTQVNVAAGITFASGLRAFLRHSPDIIVVGEIRDEETAEIATHAALTGHLLISTLHTNDAPGAIPRLIELGVQPFLAAATLNAIFAQRLIRRICSQCIASREVTAAEVKAVNEELKARNKKRELSKTIYYGQGCHACNMTGYTGRVGIFEVFIIDNEVREMIGSGHYTIDELRKAATRQNMTTMFDDGLTKVEKGLTTIEEVFRAIRE